MNRVGLLIIGDEILSGRVHDIHVQFLAQRLATRGMDVCEARFVGDDRDLIVSSLKALREKYAWVFTTGGIGSTHDDITIAAVAEAVDKPLVEHPDVMHAITKHYPNALKSFHPFGHAHIPQGATLLANPISHVPSFCINNIYVLPGMPHVMQAMVDILLEDLPQWPVVASVNIKAEMSESVLAQSLHELQEQYPHVSIGSYPYATGQNTYGTVLVARSRDEAALKEVEAALIELVQTHS